MNNWYDLKVETTPKEWLSPYIKELCEIDKKYNYNSKLERSKEDIIRSEDLWIKIHELEDKWNLLNPLEPCPKCGLERSAASGGHCFNRKCEFGSKFVMGG